MILYILSFVCCHGNICNELNDFQFPFILYILVYIYLKPCLFLVANYVFFIYVTLLQQGKVTNQRSCSKKIALPEFTDRMEKLKELDKFKLLSSLLYLKRIRL